MELLEKLANNKGTISSALGKQLAKEVLAGNDALLEETVPLVCYRLNSKKDKNIRAGAAKIVEIVAEKNPDLVAKYLETFLPALDAAEPQTRWMIIRAFGFCSRVNPEQARKGIPYAKKYIDKKTVGQLCLVSSADIFLGDYGSISEENAGEVFPILIDSTKNVIMNEHDWIMESFMKIAKYLTEKEKKMVLEFAEECKKNPRKATQIRVKKLEELCSKAEV
jgi:hypothetical protein